MKNKILLVSLAVMLVVGLVITGCAPKEEAPAPAPTPAPAPVEVQDMQLFGGSGMNYYASVAVADLLTKYNPLVRISPTETASSAANVEMSRDSDPQSYIGMSGDKSVIAGWLGVCEFEGKEPITDLRRICSMNLGHHAWVTLDKNIKTMKDLDGKRVAIMTELEGQQRTEIAFEVLGIDVNCHPMGFVEQYDALRDGTVDACMWLSTGLPGFPFDPVPPLQELIQVKTVYGIPWPHEVHIQTDKIFMERYGYSLNNALTVAPAGSLPTQTEPMEVFSAMVLGFNCKADADEDLIYSITKTIYTHYYRFGEMYPALKNITPHLMVQLMGLDAIPRQAKLLGMTQWADLAPEDFIHPGTLKYYKEVGLWPQAWDRRGEVITIQD